MALAMAGLLFLPLPGHAASDSSDWQYLTVPGDTLIGIGQRYLRNPGDWPRIQSENRVDIPKRMPTNFRLRIPVQLLKVTPAPVTVTSVTGNVRAKEPMAASSPSRPTPGSLAARPSSPVPAAVPRSVSPMAPPSPSRPPAAWASADWRPTATPA